MKTGKRTALSVMLIALVLVFSLLLGACGSQATTTAATTKAAGSTTAASGAATTAAAKTWKPTQPITLVVPYAAGGSSDLMTRAIEKVWSKYCDQPVNVTLKPGGGGVTGNLFVANSKPDGYTIVSAFGSGSEIVMPYVQPVEYKPFEQLRPICRISIHSVAIAVPASSPFKTLKEVLEDAKAKKKSVTAASSTAAGAVDFVIRGIAKRSGVDVIPIPHSGSGPAMTSLLGGQTDIGGGHPADLAAHLKSGKIRAIGIALDQRDPSMPDVPTLVEQGINLSTWGSVKGIAGPKGLPDEIVAYYEELFKKITEDADFKKSMQDMLQPIMYLNSKDFSAFLLKATDDYKKLSDELGIKEAIAAEQKSNATSTAATTK